MRQSCTSAALPPHIAVRLCLTVESLPDTGGCASNSEAEPHERNKNPTSERRSLSALCGGRAATRTTIKTTMACSPDLQSSLASVRVEVYKPAVLRTSPEENFRHAVQLVDHRGDHHHCPGSRFPIDEAAAKELRTWKRRISTCLREASPKNRGPQKQLQRFEPRAVGATARCQRSIRPTSLKG